MWVSLAILSSVLLGVYNIFQKLSLRNNAVYPILLITTALSAFLFIPLILLSNFGVIEPEAILYVPKVDYYGHALVVVKSFIVFGAWSFGYLAMKHLDLTLVGPIKAFQPVLTVTGATLILGENLNIIQWAGVGLGIISIFMMSKRKKDIMIQDQDGKFMILLILSIVFGAMSGLYDKFLMTKLDKMFVQSWYLVYQTILTTIFIIFIPRHENVKFRWKWSIPFISIFLSIADLAYFFALSDPESKIAIVSMIRRSSVLVSFIGGVIILREGNIKSKATMLFLIFISILLLYYGS
ncbi:DMT family transporter [Porphyromonas pogonae]|uniref:EamA family transporter n=1 Tax=Porphyromonas pogonae TaxID=867595 RepID=UPI002E77E4C5|nr:DMT family transporter [Porphyromonas pogonae]